MPNLASLTLILHAPVVKSPHRTKDAQMFNLLHLASVVICHFESEHSHFDTVTLLDLFTETTLSVIESLSCDKSRTALYPPRVPFALAESLKHLYLDHEWHCDVIDDSNLYQNPTHSVRDFGLLISLDKLTLGLTLYALDETPADAISALSDLVEELCFDVYDVVFEQDVRAAYAAFCRIPADERELSSMTINIVKVNEKYKINNRFQRALKHRQGWNTFRARCESVANEMCELFAEQGVELVVAFEGKTVRRRRSKK